MRESASALLAVRDLMTGYGKKQVVKGVSFDVARGEIVALIGHNGAGKSTLLRAIFGILSVWSGEVIIDGRLLNGAKPPELLRAGVAYVPQGNQVFWDMSVRENLEMGGALYRRSR